MPLRDELYERYVECHDDEVMEMVVDHLIDTAVETDEDMGIGWCCVKELIDGCDMSDLDEVVVQKLVEISSERLKVLSKYLLVDEMPELDVGTQQGRLCISKYYGFFKGMGYC